MNFDQSGLPKSPLVEEAFDFSFANMMSYQKEAMRDFTQQIDMMHQHQLMMLDAEKQAGNMSDDEYRQQKEAMEKMREDQMRIGPQMVKQELTKIFSSRRVGPALEIGENSDDPKPEIMAALLLIDTIRSPVDYRGVEQKFGSAVAGMIADLVHIDAYPTERDVNLASAGADTKRAYLALMISGLEQIVAQAREQAMENPMHRIMFPPGQEEQIFSNIKLMWGNDGKLDARVVEAFNNVSDVAGSSYKVELDGTGGIELVKSAFSSPQGPRPPAPKGPGGGGGIGGDVF